MAYTRKTYDEWEIQVNYGYGWDCETAEATLKEARLQAETYRANVGYPVRIVKKRIPIKGAQNA